MYSNDHIGDQLTLLGKLLEIKGENPFKIKAYYKGADAIAAHPQSVGELIEKGELGKLEGVGDAIRKKAEEIFATGTCSQLEELKKEIPAGVADLLKISGLGSGKIQTIWKDLGVTSIGELYYACQENRLVEVKGFGAKTQAKILHAIEFLRSNEDKFHYAVVIPHANQLIDLLRKAAPGNKIEFTGEIRRKLPYLNQIEILMDADAKSSAWDVLQKNSDWKLEESTDSISVRWKDTSITGSIQLTTNFYTDWLQSTGSDDHLKGITIPTGKFTSEDEIYQQMGMSFIPAEMREGIGEIALAKANQIPELLQWENIRGAVHNHSLWSDGMNSIEEMAKACRELGWEYFGISDHSKSAFYANGLTPIRVSAQHNEVDALNKKLAPFKIFKGIESDILFDGSLDYEDDVLASFDYIVASIHSQLNMPIEKATERLIKAIENPYTTILGHMTGRLLLVREGYPIDHKKVIDACAANNVIIELNANPYRLDIDWTHIPYALNKGVMISINPDAHKEAGLKDIHWGIEVARKAGLTAAQTLNCQPVEIVSEIFRKKNG